MAVEETCEQGPVASADVDDGLVASPVELGEPSDSRVVSLLHRPVEHGALACVLEEPRPEAGAEHARERRLPRRLERSRRPEPHAAEEVRERAPAALQQLGCLGVPEDATVRLGEDPVARERAQEPPEGVRLGVELLRELFDRAGPAGERIGDAEVRDDRQRPRAERAAHEIPEPVLRLKLGHRRAAATASATSSTSASESVRQSSRSRLSRTMPTIGGSPRRSGPTSANSSSQA